MKLQTISSLLMGSLVLAACGAETKSNGTPDEVSRANALEASNQAQSSASNATPTSLSLPTAMMEANNSVSSNGDCAFGGSSQATLESKSDNDIDLKMSLSFDECGTTKDGRVSGDLKVEIQMEGLSSGTAKINGALDAEGKNKEGEFALHKVEYNNLVYNSTQTTDGNGRAVFEETCSGTAVIDGEQMSCEEFAERVEQANQNDR